VKIKTIEFGSGKDHRTIDFFEVEGKSGKDSFLFVWHCPSCWTLTNVTLDHLNGKTTIVCSDKANYERNKKIAEEINSVRKPPAQSPPCEFSEKVDFFQKAIDEITEVRDLK